VRFLFCDRIVELERGKHAIGTRTVSIGDEFLPGHYGRRPIMPSSLVLESVTQVAGWLYIVTRDFAISTVLGVVEGVEIVGDVRPGDTMQLEVWMQYGHRDGATARGVARVGGRDVMRVSRLLFASRPLEDPASIQEAREFFDYLSGGFAVAGEGPR
jgi:3-hydroxyacyl-[acyl-carrier-protein] dehydratase